MVSFSSPSYEAYIVGVGLTKFTKPQTKNDYTEMGFEAGVKALYDAHIHYKDVEIGVGSYCYGDSTQGQRVFYQFGMTGIPIYNVNNNCASGSTGMVMARDFVKSGAADCVLVVGFEKMLPGSLGSNFQDRRNPLDKAMAESRKQSPGGTTKAPWAAQMFANAANEYISRYGAQPEDFAEIASVNHEHSKWNPYSQFRNPYSTKEVLSSPMVAPPLTKLQCCPTSDGAAAAVVVSKAFLEKHSSLKDQAVLIVGQALRTDDPSAYSGSAMGLIGYQMTQRTARQALSEAGVGIQDVKVVELHDCFSANEMVVIDALGLSPKGKAHEYVRQRQITYGSKSAVINPSGGLISKGHPLGATGIVQCTELVWQLRGWANNRLVPVRAGQVALQQNAGLGGACVVSILQRADGQENALATSAEVVSLTGLDYNPAVEAKGVTGKQIERVCCEERLK